ncbi:MAG: hypothetical protein IKE24_02740 [Clostridia bacterium]|nr:hypothetical protein [Clostridia bacterium]
MLSHGAKKGGVDDQAFIGSVFLSFGDRGLQNFTICFHGTLPYPFFLSFDRAFGQAGDEEFVQNQVVYNGHGQDRNANAGKHQVPG